MTKEEIKKEKNWAKKCRAISSYHKSKVEERHSNKRKEKWTQEDTASELEISKGLVNESLALTKAFELYPELANGTRSRALDFIRRD